MHLVHSLGNHEVTTRHWCRIRRSSRTVETDSTIHHRTTTAVVSLRAVHDQRLLRIHSNLRTSDVSLRNVLRRRRTLGTVLVHTTLVLSAIHTIESSRTLLYFVSFRCRYCRWLRFISIRYFYSSAATRWTVISFSTFLLPSLCAVVSLFAQLLSVFLIVIHSFWSSVVSFVCLFRLITSFWTILADAATFTPGSMMTVVSLFAQHLTFPVRRVC